MARDSTPTRISFHHAFPPSVSHSRFAVDFPALVGSSLEEGVMSRTPHYVNPFFLFSLLVAARIPRTHPHLANLCEHPRPFALPCEPFAPPPCEPFASPPCDSPTRSPTGSSPTPPTADQQRRASRSRPQIGPRTVVPPFPIVPPFGPVAPRQSLGRLRVFHCSRASVCLPFVYLPLGPHI